MPTEETIVTETTIDPKLPVDQVVSALRARKTTGQFIVHLSQGGIQKVSLLERRRAKRQVEDAAICK